MTAFEKIAAGLEDAIAFAEGNGGSGQIVRGADVKAIRAMTRLSQAAFARKLRISAATVRDWEQGRRVPDAPARTLLCMVAANPQEAFALIDRGAGPT